MLEVKSLCDQAMACCDLGLQDLADQMTRLLHLRHRQRAIDLLSFAPLSRVAQWKSEVAAGRNPRDIKVTFAQEIVARFHSDDAARDALTDFEARFKQGEIPHDIAAVSVKASADGAGIAHVLKEAGLTPSTSEAFRMIAQGGVKLQRQSTESLEKRLQATGYRPRVGFRGPNAAKPQQLLWPVACSL